MARKSPARAKKEFRDRAKEKIKEETRKASEFATTPFIVAPLTRPLASPIRRLFPRTVDAIVDSRLLDNAIDQQINRLTKGRSFGSDETLMMSREEQLDAAIRVAKELGTDPESIQALEELTKAAGIPSSFESGREVIRRSRQFDLQNLLPRMVENRPRTRRKTKTDKNMAKALRMANNKLRTKKGKLRKGKTQSDVMRLAHRLRKKM